VSEKNEKMTELLPVQLTDEEWDARADEMAATEKKLLIAEGRELEFAEHAKYEKKKLESVTADLRSKLSCQATVVREKQEKREVEVVERKDFEGSAVRLIRIDTGEVVRTRAMTEADRQRALFGAEKTGTSD
jgi:hypothetical protein